MHLIDPIAVDTFDRSASDGWGVADSGHTWELSGGAPSQYAVADGVGIHHVEVVNATRRTRLPLSLTDVEVLMAVSVPVYAEGGNIEISPMLRIDPADIGGTYYYTEVEFNYKPVRSVRARLMRRQNGSDTQLTAAYDLPLTYAPDQVIWIRAVMVGDLIQMRVWADGTPEPHHWAAAARDDAIAGPGQVGVRSTLDPGNVNTLPVSTRIHQFAVYDPALTAQARPFRPCTRFEGTDFANIASTAYAPGSPECGITFVAPPSGEVVVQVAGNVAGTSSNRTALSFEIREINSGGQVVVAADDYNGILSDNAAGGRKGGPLVPVVGLVPYGVYYARTMHRVFGASGSGTVYDRRITVVPVM
jgi:hypothetical protein